MIEVQANKASRYDPTHTTVLRNAFVRNMNKRFMELIKVIVEGIVKQDCFALKEKETITVQQMLPPGNEAFRFMRDPAKIDAFMQWLERQVDKGILEVTTFPQLGQAIEEAWTNMYIADSYKRGIQRARYELKRAGFTDIADLGQVGGIDAIFSAPYHMDRVGLIYTRVYSALKGITAAMETQISQILAQGMIDGDGPALLARKLIAVIEGRDMGTLGITDSLGRFIPAATRAKMLARTEIIRAHHLATIQEYRNWGVEGVFVMAEWMTAGDDRVCDKCNSLQGKIFTLDEIEGMIPVHPNCFADRQIPVYTSEGWKSIGDVKIGDLVLTHKGRFRKVYALPRHYGEVGTEMITLKFKGDLHLSMTANHPVSFINKENNTFRWREVNKVTQGTSLSILANTCKRCGKDIPYFRKYCTRTCLSKDITKKQWSNPLHREIISKKNRKSMLLQYSSGQRDAEKGLKKARIAIRKMIEKGEHPFQNLEVIAKNKLVTNLPIHKKVSSERMKKANPMKDPVTVQKVKYALEDLYSNHPEKRLNVRMAKYRKSGKKTWIEERVAKILDKLEIMYIFQYPILRYNVDFAIPELKIAIECDGEQWHQDKEKERVRQKNLEKEGWTVLHYTGAMINQHIDFIEEELSRVLCNHLGEFHFISWPVEKVTTWKLKRERLLYNLSVEEDESYIAKGVVVHNCRCIALPYLEELKKYY